MPVLTDLSEDSTIEPSAGMRMDPDKAKSIWFPKNLLSKSSKSSTPTCKLPLVSIYCHSPWVFCWSSNHGRKAANPKNWVMNSLQWTAASLEEASMVAATWPDRRLPEINSLGKSMKIKPSNRQTASLHPLHPFFFAFPSAKWSLGQSFTSLIPPCPRRYSFCLPTSWLLCDRDIWDQIRSEALGLNFALIQCTIARRSQGALVFRPTPKGEMHRISLECFFHEIQIYTFTKRTQLGG